MYYPRFTKVIIHHFLTQDKTLSWRNKIGMHTSKVDYLINTLRFISEKEETQIYGAILPDTLTSPEMKESKAYKTYLGFASGATPPKKAQKFKNPASPKLTTVPVSTEEPTGKSKRVKRPAKKSTKAPARGVVIRETPEIPISKKKEKVNVTRVTKTAQSAAKIKPSVTSEGTGVKPGVPDVAEEESSKSEAESWGNDEDDSNNKQESSGEDSDQKNDSDDDETQSDNENDNFTPEHRECYKGLKKSYDIDNTIFSTFGKVYSLKRSRKDKDEDPSVGSDRGLKKRKLDKDATPATGPKAKESQSGLSKGDKSQSKSSGKSIQSEELEFEVADSDMLQDQEENLGKDDEEPKEKVASKRDWFTKPTQPQEPTDPNWNVDKTPQQG
ncbi:hypothetical protein Tco_1164335 [Tanacetum coccineum]